jgi:release factor glutamine methyltransferase
VDARGHALLELGRSLREQGYAFVTPTPETHRRVNQRAEQREAWLARDLRDVFGWSRPFRPDLLPARLQSLLEASGELTQDGELVRSRVRFSTLRGLLLVHSAFPTSSADSVFFGPDTYRFCALLERWAPRAQRAVDVGCGSGAGGLCLLGKAASIVLADINPRALALAEVNAALAGIEAERVQSDVLASVDGPLDLIVANPPYMRDPGARMYRDGGGAHGEGLSVRIVRESLARLSHGGKLIVYTGSAIVAGRDSFHDAVQPVLQEAAVNFTYEELDPDVFGEELSEPGYEQVERIAAVGLKVVR